MSFLIIDSNLVKSIIWFYATSMTLYDNSDSLAIGLDRKVRLYVRIYKIYRPQFCIKIAFRHQKYHFLVYNGDV